MAISIKKRDNKYVGTYNRKISREEIKDLESHGHKFLGNRNGKSQIQIGSHSQLYKNA